MTYQRRHFIKMGATLSSGLLLGSVTSKLSGCSPLSKINVHKNFGLQLYTLRDDLPKDPKAVLTQVASFGYNEIESFEGDKGMFWGMKNTEFKTLMDDLGMKIVSSHCDINHDFEKKAEEAAAIGMKYLICPYFGPHKHIDAFKKLAETFNQRGETCKKYGLGFAYHNHDYSFAPVEGQLPQDVMMQGTDKDLVDFEMDIYWVVTAGQDPLNWFNRYPGRFKLGHIKDRKKNVSLSDKNESTVLGEGSIDFNKILKEGAKKGMRHFIVEQERYDNTTPLLAAQADANYMKGLDI